MTALSKLKKDHNYTQYTTSGDSCRSCNHYKNEKNYEGVEGMSGKVCRLYRDSDTDAGVIILVEDHGVCNSYE